MLKAVWIAVPLLVLAVVALVRALRGRPLDRHALNVYSSLLLLGYVSVTAGLGIFWVANQQLPVFDLHYLFGYVTVIALVVHLGFNLRVVIRHFRRPKHARVDGARRDQPIDGTIGSRVVEPRMSASRIGGWVAVGVAMLGAFALGTRHGKTEVSVAWSAEGARADPNRGPVDVVERYHEISSHSRSGVLARAPMVDWGTPPPPKTHPGAPRVALPALLPSPPSRPLSEALLEAPARRGSGVPELADLASVLFHGAGVTDRRGGLALRASPSSGALFASELYLAVREAKGLEPGLYHYEPIDHVLERIGDAPPLSPVTGRVEPAATVMLTAVFRRTGHKYRDRAYRYVTADAGHLLENVRLAAAEAGYYAAPLPLFDDAAADRVLSIDGAEEAVIAVLPLAAEPPAMLERSAPAFRYRQSPERPAALGVTNLVHEATSLVGVPPADDESPALSLAPPDRASKPVLTVIASRRSIRDFSGATLRAEDVAAILRHATGPLASLSEVVRVHVVIHRVAGVAPGAYRYDPHAHALRVSRAGNLATEARAAALDQDVIGDAAMVVVLTLDRGGLGGEGARGYRNGFLQAGMIGERMLLEAGARDLGACPVGAFYDREAAALIGVDPEREWPAHFAAFGAR